MEDYIKAHYKIDDETIKLGNQFGLEPETVLELLHRQVRTIIKKEIITPENKSNCIFFLACNKYDFFNKMYHSGFINMNDILECVYKFPTCMTYLPQEVIKDEAFAKEIVKNVKPDWYDFLPYYIANMPEVQEKCNRTAKIYRENGLDSNGYNIDWVNENGELLSFFKLKENFPINSKADYFKLYKEYLESKVSVHAFCGMYGIDSQDGFNKFLKRVEAESFEEFSKIKDIKFDIQKSFYALSKETAKQIINGEITFEDFLNDNRINFNSTKIDLYFNSLSFEDRNKMAHVIMEYVENNPYLLSSRFIDFLTINNLKPTDSFNMFIKRNLKMPDDKQFFAQYYNELRIIEQQEKSYHRRELYCTYVSNDQRFEVNDNVIDQAYAYAVAKRIHVSKRSMLYLTKEIAKGTIKYEEETNNQKQEMIDSIIKLINEEKSIEDYIETMKQSRSMK